MPTLCQALFQGHSRGESRQNSLLSFAYILVGQMDMLNKVRVPNM